jgi:signal transduction histidine kinase
VQVEIADRGTGFDLANQSRLVESGHFGLFSIQERLDYLGGTFKIQSTPGEGTTVTLAIPLSTAKVAAADL